VDHVAGVEHSHGKPSVAKRHEMAQIDGHVLLRSNAEYPSGTVVATGRRVRHPSPVGFYLRRLPTRRSSAAGTSSPSAKVAET
jgi:hypothetical protein